MPKPQVKPWLDKEGKIITVGDCIDALNTSMSLILKEITYNRALMDGPAVKAEYERKRLIIEKIKTSYEMAAMLTKQPTREIPSKKKKKGGILEH